MMKRSIFAQILMYVYKNANTIVHYEKTIFIGYGGYCFKFL